MSNDSDRQFVKALITVLLIGPILAGLFFAIAAVLALIYGGWGFYLLRALYSTITMTLGIALIFVGRGLWLKRKGK